MYNCHAKFPHLFYSIIDTPANELLSIQKYHFGNPHCVASRFKKTGPSVYCITSSIRT